MGTPRHLFFFFLSLCKTICILGFLEEHQDELSKISLNILKDLEVVRNQKWVGPEFTSLPCLLLNLGEVHILKNEYIS